MNYLEIEQVISKPYITAKEISMIYPVGITNARKVVDAICRDMEAKGTPLPKARKKLVPTERVLKKLGLNAELIHREARNLERSIKQ